MTRYEKYMQHIHNQATALAIEQAVNWLIMDIEELLIIKGVKPGSELLNKIKALQSYEYKQPSSIPSNNKH